MPPHVSLERIAGILVDAMYNGDDVATKRAGVSKRSIQRWRARLRTDTKLAALVAQKNERATDDWAGQINGAIAAGIDLLRRAAQVANAADPDVIHAVAGYIKVLAEVQLTREIIDARFSKFDQPDSPAGRPLAGSAHRRNAPGRRLIS